MELHPKKILPILKFNFSKKRICESVISLLYFALQESNITSNEKIRCLDNLDLIFRKILKFDIKHDFEGQQILHKQELQMLAKQLEGQLYERVFSYFPEMNKE